MNIKDLRLRAYQNATKKTNTASNALANTSAISAAPATPSVKGGGYGDFPVLTKNGTGTQKALQKTNDSIYRQVAKFLVLIGSDEAAKVLPHLTPTQQEKIIPEIASIRHIEKDEAAIIFAQFDALLKQSRQDGGVQTAKDILEKAFGKEKAAQMIEKTVAFPDGKPFEYLFDLEIAKICALLNTESPAVKALVLSQLPPQKAASVINEMTQQDKKDVILRLAKMKTVAPDVIKRVDSSMQEKLKNVNIQNSNAIDGLSSLAQILRQMPIQKEENILENIKRQNLDLECQLRNLLFTTDDIVQGDDVYIQRLLRSMQDRDIVLLIAGKKDAFRDKMLNNVSQNRKKDILEKEDIEKPFKKSECQSITTDFINKLYKAYEQGDFIIKGRNEEVYV